MLSENYSLALLTVTKVTNAGRSVAHRPEMTFLGLKTATMITDERTETKHAPLALSFAETRQGEVQRDADLANDWRLVFRGTAW